MPTQTNRAVQEIEFQFRFLGARIKLTTEPTSDIVEQKGVTIERQLLNVDFLQFDVVLPDGDAFTINLHTLNGTVGWISTCITLKRKTRELLVICYTPPKD